MEYISTTQLREDFGALRDGLARGESYTLIHRSRPIAQIEPYYQEETKMATEEKVAKLKDLAGRFSFETDYTPDELNRMYDEDVYDTYE